MDILNWIDVGKISAERDDLLSEYFYDNGVLSRVIDSKSLFLILGRKGAGKTAVFKYLTENPTEFLKNGELLISLSFEDYNWNIHSLLVNRDSAESLAYKQSWRFVILIEVIKAHVNHLEKTGKPIPKPLTKAKSLLQKLFDEPIPSIYSIVGRKLLSLSRLQLPKGGLDLESGKFDNLELSGGEVSFDSVKSDSTLQDHISQNIENIIRYLEDAIEKCGTLKPKIFIAFDRVDEAWDEISVVSSKKVIAGLISAADSITAQFSDSIRPIVFLREDIFDVLSLNDANKLREDCGALLHWERESLFKLVLRRVNYFATKQNIETVQDLDDLFDKKEMRQRTRPSNYLLKRAMMRPRDLICFMRRVIDTMKERVADPFEEMIETYNTLQAEMIYDAEPGYSEWLKQELLDEWAVQFPEIRTLFDAIQNNGSTNITSEQLIAEYAKMGTTLDRGDVLKHLRFLFDNSIIGFKLGASTIWRYKCFYPSQGFVEAGEYRIHEGLVRALNLKEPRDRDESLSMVNFNESAKTP
ncbi:MAG: hypothetical protein JW764_09175 [Chlorobiaceae bacterium]|nr:hypothetical protein [Chlorobiaceae bacterium]